MTNDPNGYGHNWVSKNQVFRNGTCVGKLSLPRLGMMTQIQIKYMCWAISCACAQYEYFFHIVCQVSVLKRWHQAIRLEGMKLNTNGRLEDLVMTWTKLFNIKIERTMVTLTGTTEVLSDRQVLV